MARQILGGSERESWLDHHPAWLSRPEADRLLAELLAGLAWEQRDIVLFGRRIAQPRLVAWGSERPYRYSGQTLPPRALPPPLTEILARVNEATGCGFDHILANRYRDGRDSMGMHADDEPELGPSPVVASLSLGATRRFVYAPKKKAAFKTGRGELHLAHGDLLVMGGSFQRDFRHGLPKTTASLQRVSLTFRQIVERSRAG